MADPDQARVRVSADLSDRAASWTELRYDGKTGGSHGGEDCADSHRPAELLSDGPRAPAATAASSSHGYRSRVDETDAGFPSAAYARDVVPTFRA
jgi:hypothetical protein